MANKNIRRGPAAGGAPPEFTNRVTANDVYVDAVTGALTLGTSSSGTASKIIADNVIAAQSTTTPYIETASVANGGSAVPGVAGGGATSVTLLKYTTAILDNTATTIYTVTVPNIAAAATITVLLTASLGAGGAIGAMEESLTAYGQIILTRTAGVACVATAVALSNTGKANVAGADSTATLAYAVTAMTGAVGATQTFNIQVTIVKGGGSSTNHTCLAEATVYNAAAAGVTIA